ncbi:hypothetical protein BRARA_K00874 [Brassica rapa]|uniref:Reverse transcriptase zinc-binding domain-containing protein n=1 Tax=Brassica campestris TaxID=3711 RepID=A0A397KWW8_BRACM|nr:hypothetical protein BRARA_K00874 [Brassica rapa]
MLSGLHEANAPANRSLPPVEKQLWKSLWKLKTSPKIRHFLWRALSGALAVAERLQSRGLCNNTTCLACGQASETISHVLFNCPTAVEVWRLAGIQPPSAGFSHSSVFLNLHYLVAGSKKQQGDQNRFEAFPWVLWHLWKARNALVFEKTRLTPNSITTKALEESVIWFLAQQQVPEPTTVEVSTNSLIGTWEKPPSDMVKCNVGMTWSDTCLMSGSSWIVRDYQGQAIQHSRQAITGSSSKRESDIRSLLWAVQAMGDLRHKKVLFEASSLEVREALLNPLRFPELSPLILKILELLNRFEKWAIFHVSAHKNRIVKNIAESVILGTRLQSYVAAGGPGWLHEMLEEDANST